MNVYLVRHGQTDWNAAHRIQGHSDIPLNPTGQDQAQRCAARFSAWRAAGQAFDCVISSDLLRAQETARIIATHLDLPLQLEPALRERHYGQLEGIQIEQIEQRYPHFYQARQQRQIDFRFTDAPNPGAHEAESLLMLQQRAQQTLEAIRQQALLQGMLGCILVSHGGLIDVLLRQVQGIALAAPQSLHIDNTSVHCLRWHQSNWQLQAALS